jgi:hypothetical protein
MRTLAHPVAVLPPARLPGVAGTPFPAYVYLLSENPRAVAARTYPPSPSVFLFFCLGVAIWEALYSSVSHLATIARATSKAIVVACCQNSERLVLSDG